MSLLKPEDPDMDPEADDVVSVRSADPVLSLLSTRRGYLRIHPIRSISPPPDFKEGSSGMLDFDSSSKEEEEKEEKKVKAEVAEVKFATAVVGSVQSADDPGSTEIVERLCRTSFNRLVDFEEGSSVMLDCYSSSEVEKKEKEKS